MPLSNKAKFQAKAQKIYFEELLKIARMKIDENSPVDPQGRVLVEISLDRDYLAIYKKLCDMEDSEFTFRPILTKEAAIKNIQAAIGITIQETTLVSLDIRDNEDLYSSFHEQVLIAFHRHDDADIHTHEWMEQCHQSIKAYHGSIIALQQELHFHLALAAKVYLAGIQELNDEYIEPAMVRANQIKNAHAETMQAVNKLVLEEYAKALMKAQKDNVIDVSILNKALDKARKKIAPKAHAILVSKIALCTDPAYSNNRGFPRIDLTKLTLDEKKLRRLAKKTTATGNDMLHFDSELGLATWIEGSTVTAHDRGLGREHLANRRVITHILPFNPYVLEAEESGNIQIRIPSPDAKGSEITLDDTIADVVNKFTFMAQHYQFQEQLLAVNDLKLLEARPKAFVYNLYTSLYTTWFGKQLIDGKNSQTTGAEKILQAAHFYNAQEQQKADPVYCFIQNIPVNGFGATLRYGSGNAILEEATVMADMALLHTLYSPHWVDIDEVPPLYNEIRNTYNDYLEYLGNLNAGEKPLKLSQFSSKIAGYFIRIKEKLAQAELTPVNSLSGNAKLALERLVANNLHFSHDYAKLVQTLSLIVEEAAINGCKSGNERTPAIMARANTATFISYLLRSTVLNDTEKRAIQLKLEAVITCRPEEIQQKALNLKNGIDALYNKVKLQSAETLISLDDQGSAPKVEAKKGLFYWLSTNNAEESATVMSNVHQNTGFMQAHKGMVDLMLGAVGQQKTPWLKSIKNLFKPKPFLFFALGAAGLGVASVFFPPLAIGIAAGVYLLAGASGSIMATAHNNAKNKQQTKDAIALELEEAHIEVEDMNNIGESTLAILSSPVGSPRSQNSSEEKASAEEKTPLLGGTFSPLKGLRRRFLSAASLPAEAEKKVHRSDSLPEAAKQVNRIDSFYF